MNIQEIIQLSVSSLTLLGLIWVTIGRVKDPDAEASKEIAVIKEQINSICSSIKLINENHLTHIEKAVSNLEKDQARLFTILEERLPNKK